MSIFSQQKDIAALPSHFGDREAAAHRGPMFPTLERPIPGQFSNPNRPCLFFGSWRFRFNLCTQRFYEALAACQVFMFSMPKGLAISCR
jgi:hypothetical protein